MENIRKQIVDLINKSERILVMPSSPVDGDSLGSSLAMYLVLKKLGKQVTVVCADPVPDAFRFLPTTSVISNEFSANNDFIVTLDCKKSKLKTIKTKLEQDKFNIIITSKKGKFTADDVSFDHGPNKYDLIITVDAGDIEQLGKFYTDNPEIFVTIPVINIDHHASNANFGKINLVDIMSSSTTELLIPLIQDMEKRFGRELFDEDIATLLLAGIITDTGSFQNANTTPRSFAASAQLIKYGARQQEIIKHVFKTKNLSTLRLWGRILTKIKVDKEHYFVWSSISRKDFENIGAREDETGGIIDELLSNAPGAEIVLLLKEKENGIISGSLRTTTPSVDASAIAEMFGGGGHVQAAGFKIESKDIEETEKIVVEKIREYQRKRHRISSGLENEVTETTVLPSVKQSEASTATESKQFQPEKEIVKETHPEATISIEKSIPEEITAPEEEKSFLDTIIKNAKNEETDLEEGITYKFED